jgi:hypothetical protein
VLSVRLTFPGTIFRLWGIFLWFVSNLNVILAHAEEGEFESPKNITLFIETIFTWRPGMAEIIQI